MEIMVRGIHLNMEDAVAVHGRFARWMAHFPGLDPTYPVHDTAGLGSTHVLAL
jgi:hypothetical protein